MTNVFAHRETRFRHHTVADQIFGAATSVAVQSKKKSMLSFVDAKDESDRTQNTAWPWLVQHIEEESASAGGDE